MSPPTNGPRFVGQPPSNFVSFGVDPSILVEQYRQRAQELQSMIDRLQTASLKIGSVFAVQGERAMVQAGNDVFSSLCPWGLGIVRGSTVLVTGDGGIAAVVDDPPRLGFAWRVERVLAEDEVEVGNPGMPQKVIAGTRLRDLAEGDLVLVSGDGRIVTHKLPPEPSKMAWGEPTGVDWGDVGGLAEAKRAMREAVEDPYVHAGVYKRHGHRAPKGILLHGRPGNGKTMLGKAAATAIARVHGTHAGAFIYVKGPEILNKWVGASEGSVRSIFESARAHKRQHGYPALVFIDEADAIFCKRGSHVNEGMERTVVPQFLAEMDGLDESAALVVIATNRPEVLDPAVVRDGRCDRKVEVTSPTLDDAADIIGKALAGKRVVEDSSPFMPTLTAKRIWEHKAAILMLKSRKGHDRRVTVRHFVSGAMCVGIVGRAVAAAVRREIDSGEESAVCQEDLYAAVDAAAEELRGLDPVAVVAEVAREMGDDFAGLVPVSAPSASRG